MTTSDLFNVPRETLDRLHRYADLLATENGRQNLIARGSEGQIWHRHIIDGAQLLGHAPKGANWLDIGSGAGLPGIVLAILGVTSITLVEPRRLRTDFLSRCVEALHLSNATIVTGKVERVFDRFDVVTARAVASLPRLFALAEKNGHSNSRWVLPKGRSAAKELAEARLAWQGDFRLEVSLTDPDSWIVVATGVRRRAKA